MKLLWVLFLCFLAIFADEFINRLPRVGKTTRIIGGDLAAAGQFPSVVAIYKDTEDGRYFCGGALITDQWVLTAAQCVYNATLFTIRMGSNQLDSTDANRVIVATETYFYFPNYNGSFDFDLGLIKLRLPVPLTDYIKPVVFANWTIAEILPGTEVDVVGWGQTSDTDPLIVNDLRAAKVSIIDNTDCQITFGSIISGGMVCAVGNYNEGICYGDIGGPLLSFPPIENYTVVSAVGGFISGNGCERPDPSVFTRIDTYWGWIVDTLNNNTYPGETLNPWYY